MSFGIIYKVTNLINEKVYIGQTILKFKRRKQIHENCKQGWYFNRAIRKYGKNNFEWGILEHCDSKEELDEMEFHYIKQYNTFGKNGYNLTYGGDGVIGYKHSEENKKKISNSNKGRIISIETRERMSEAQKNRSVISDETRMKMSLNRKGKKLTEEHKEKIRQAHIGKIRKPFSEKTLENMSKAKKGISNVKNRKKYVITFPDKNKYIIKGLKNFCKMYKKYNNGFKLVPSYLSECATNKRESYKNFKCRYYNSEIDLYIPFWKGNI